MPTKKPKKGWKTKTTTLDSSEILEVEIPVAASQEVNCVTITVVKLSYSFVSLHVLKSPSFMFQLKL